MGLSNRYATGQRLSQAFIIIGDRLQRSGTREDLSIYTSRSSHREVTSIDQYADAARSIIPLRCDTPPAGSWATLTSEDAHRRHDKP